MRVDQALADELHRHGVRQIFGLMGEDTAKLILRLTALGASYLSSRHELGAVGMADGYARVTGDLGVAVLSRGPGFLNGLTSLVTASRSGSKVLVLVAHSADALPREPTVRATARRSHKFIDQESILDAIGVEHLTFHDPATAAADLAATIARVRTGVTLVVNLPMDYVVASFDQANPRSSVVLAPPSGPRPPDPAEIEQVADLLETTWAASNPIVLAGRGAVRADAGADLARLAEMTGSLVTTTLPATSMFRGDPFDLGIMGTFSTDVASELLARCDVLLAFGASLNRLTTYGNALTPKARIVHFDDDPAAFGKHVEAELVVHGDVALAAKALIAELERRGHRYEGYRTSAIAEQIASFDRQAGIRDQSDAEGLDTRVVSIALNDAIPKERVLVFDPGHYFALMLPFFDVADPKSLVLPLDFGAIGTGGPMATGAALAQRDRLTVLAAGDGGYMLTMSELDTAIRARVPLLVLVFNDSAYGAEVHILGAEGLPTELARFDVRAFDQIAVSMGAEGIPIHTLADVDCLRKRLEHGLDGVLVADVRITTAVRADFVNAISLVTGQKAK